MAELLLAQLLQGGFGGGLGNLGSLGGVGRTSGIKPGSLKSARDVMGALFPPIEDAPTPLPELGRVPGTELFKPSGGNLLFTGGSPFPVDATPQILLNSILLARKLGPIIEGIFGTPEPEEEKKGKGSGRPKPPPTLRT